MPDDPTDPLAAMVELRETAEWLATKYERDTLSAEWDKHWGDFYDALTPTFVLDFLDQHAQLLAEVAALRADLAEEQARVTRREASLDEQFGVAMEITAERDAARAEVAALRGERDRLTATLNRIANWSSWSYDPLDWWSVACDMKAAARDAAALAPEPEASNE